MIAATYLLLLQSLLLLLWPWPGYEDDTREVRVGGGRRGEDEHVAHNYWESPQGEIFTPDNSCPF